MTAMKRRKYRKRIETERKYLQTLCNLKVERKKVWWLTKLNEKCDDVAVNAKTKENYAAKSNWIWIAITEKNVQN